MITPFDSAESHSARSMTTPISPGLQVGDYRIEEKIGAGGMGAVYRAAHSQTGRRVAVKILSGRLARNPNAIRRFILEARTVNEIRHQNLVDIYSFGQLTDGRYYYAMEYLAGQSLGTVLRARGRLTAAQALPVFLDVLHALEATHATGVVHRDLKPDNVFLIGDESGAMARAKLLDFGLAKLLEPEKTDALPLTAAGMAVGTPQYMSPEQCMAKAVDARTDLYSLGVMLYETMTGQLPCVGKGTLEIWEAHVRRVPRRPSEVAPGEISDELDAVIMKLLAKTPAARYQTAGEVREALEGQALTLGLDTLMVGQPAGDRSSALEVARALPSSVHSSDTVPLGSPSSPSPRPTSEAEALREALDFSVHIEEPALETQDPSQVSAINIQLASVDLGPHFAQLAPVTAATSSGRLRKSARLPKPWDPLARWGLVALVLAALSLTGALILGSP